MAGVLSLGEVLIDIIADDDSISLETANHFSARPGGAPANVAVALTRLGVPAGFCGAVGNDPFGLRLKAVLEQNAVETGCLAVIDGVNTTIAFAWRNAQGDGNFRILRMADTQLDSKMIASAGIATRSAIVVGSVGLTDDPSRSAIQQAVQIARDHGVPVVVDINIRPSLWASADEAREACQSVMDSATILKLSVDDADFLFGDRDPKRIFARRYIGEPIVLLTDGARGSWFRNADGSVEHVPAFKIEPIEPTGAGDAFTAAIISRFIVDRRAPGRDDLLFASAAGAITATRVGAIESLPYLCEIEHFLGR